MSAGGLSAEIVRGPQRRQRMRLGFALASLAVGLLAASAVQAQSDDHDLAKQLTNPVASLISVPLQNNFDCCYGDELGFRYTLNIQPVVPVSLNKDWNLIVRTIVPIVYQEEAVAGAGDHFGLGDVTQSFFFSPKASRNGLIWAVGPAFLWPLGSSHIGSGKWAAGPTVLVLKQTGPTSVGLLANHLWSYAGAHGRDEVNATFLQPFLSYVYPNTTTITINSESTYDWSHQQWTVPVNAGVSHLYKFGGQKVNLGLQGRFYAVSPDGPQWGARFVATLLFPK
jgi:hypothetical protein